MRFPTGLIDAAPALDPAPTTAEAPSTAPDDETARAPRFGLTQFDEIAWTPTTEYLVQGILPDPSGLKRARNVPLERQLPRCSSCRSRSACRLNPLLRWVSSRTERMTKTRAKSAPAAGSLGAKVSPTSSSAARMITLAGAPAAADWLTRKPLCLEIKTTALAASRSQRLGFISRHEDGKLGE
jgi:hypothetical protein